MTSKKESQPKKKKINNFPYDFVKVTGIIPAWIWLRPKLHYVSDKAKKRVKGGVLFAGNHSTFIDPIAAHLAFWYRRMRCLATKDLYNTPAKARMFTLMNCIMVDKENFNIGSLHDAIDALKDDQAVLIFPEGGVNRKTDEVKSFKSGVILMAHLGKKPIVPFYIVKPKKWYNRYHIVIGEQINVQEMCGKIPTVEELEKMSTHLHDKEVELATYYEQYVKRKQKTADVEVNVVADVEAEIAVEAEQQPATENE